MHNLSGQKSVSFHVDRACGDDIADYFNNKNLLFSITFGCRFIRKVGVLSLIG